MRSVFREVETEPQLLPYAEEDLSGKTANRAPEARLDFKVKSFWTRDQAAFFDVRVTHPKSSLQTLPELQRQLERNEREKKRQYCQRVNLIDRGVFTPLVFTTNGLVGQECNRCLKSLASAIARKNADLSYSKIITHLRTRLSFSLLRWCITCIRGSRTSYTARKSDFLASCKLVR